MKLAALAIMLVGPALAQTNSWDDARWARQETMRALREARREVREATFRSLEEAQHVRMEARRAVAEARKETVRAVRQQRLESQRYRRELLRDIRHRDQPDTTGMKRIF